LSFISVNSITMSYKIATYIEMTAVKKGSAHDSVQIAKNRVDE